MRIHTIRLANLNALTGTWEIDLDHPAYNDNIYALTGPTGAGKTTILDAISLALYGRTPRLARIGKTGNEIMSRHSGTCHAEITFSTRTGRYRSHWSQHCARRKAGDAAERLAKLMPAFCRRLPDYPAATKPRSSRASPTFSAPKPCVLGTRPMAMMSLSNTDSFRLPAAS